MFTSGHARVLLSVIVPVRNEEANIAACLESVAWAAQIIVVDSHSGDCTVEIARRFGAEIHQFEYTGTWPRKKNWALMNLPLEHDWILLLDADERVPEELAAEINRIVAAPGDVDGYYVNRRLVFLGRWIRHCGWYPSWNMRLFRRGRGRFERLHDEEPAETGDVEVHEHVIVDGQTGYLEHDLIHEDFKNIGHFVERHNRYSTWEAALRTDRAMDRGTPGALRARPFGSPLERKRWLKNLSLRLPFRPLVKFLWMYVLKGGLLDGRPGFIFCSLMAFHEAVIDAKTYEMRLLRANPESRAPNPEVRPCAASPVL